MLSKVNAQSNLNDSIKLDYTRIFFLALDGNLKQALPLLEIGPTKKIAEKNLKFKTDFENRFRYEEDKISINETF